LKQLEHIDDQLKDEMDIILDKLQSGEEITLTEEKVGKKKKGDVKKKLNKKEKRKLSELLADEEVSSGEDKKTRVINTY
jgi:hypothetical protein